MTIIERVKTLAVPLDEVVVIGSGLLDALGLRESHDVDLVVSRRLFADLKLSGSYTCLTKHGEEVLEKDDVEIWQSWGHLADEQFDGLKRTGIAISGVTFCSANMIIRHKEARGSEKDLRDIALLSSYRGIHSDLIP